MTLALLEPGRPRASTRVAPAGPSRLRVGLVNNMPDAALTTTERQFAGLLGPEIELELYFLPEIVRGEAAERWLDARYRAVSTLHPGDIDALIVTGAEPKATRLQDEPFWPSLCALVDRARAYAIPTLWSCLAAHAAVLHLDGVGRRRLERKCSGVFECVAVGPHLLAPTTRSWVPHSRHNTLDGDDLADAGYTLISRAEGAGVDAFVGQGGDFVFLQGHPEYDPDSLALEYQRDFSRFARRLSACPPDPPVNYLDPETEAKLRELTARILGGQGRPGVGELGRLLASRRPGASWRSSAERFYAGWLSQVAGRRAVGRDLETSK